MGIKNDGRQDRLDEGRASDGLVADRNNSGREAGGRRQARERRGGATAPRRRGQARAGTGRHRAGTRQARPAGAGARAPPTHARSLATRHSRPTSAARPRNNSPGRTASAGPCSRSSRRAALIGTPPCRGPGTRPLPLASSFRFQARAVSRGPLSSSASLSSPPMPPETRGPLSRAIACRRQRWLEPATLTESAVAATPAQPASPLPLPVLPTRRPALHFNAVALELMRRLCRPWRAAVRCRAR